MIQVKVFDHDHEKDLEEEINRFLEEKDERKVVDIKYQVAISCEQQQDQIYCFSAMVVYKV